MNIDSSNVQTIIDNRLIESFKKSTFSGYKKTDVIAKRTMWNDYTDALCKDGLITTNQYINWHQPF